MRTSARLEASYRHGLRVRMGPTGPKGVLLHCEKKDGGGQYWRVRLQSGAWVWPDASMVLDGPGTDVKTCASCDLPFLTVAIAGEVICSRCDAEQHGTAAERAADVQAPPQRRWNQRRRWRP